MRRPEDSGLGAARLRSDPVRANHRRFLVVLYWGHYFFNRYWRLLLMMVPFFSSAGVTGRDHH